MPSKIHTPCGKWSILGSGSGDFKKVFDSISGPLGLKLYKEATITCDRSTLGPYWEITQWNNTKIEKAKYRKFQNFIPNNQVKKVWEKFKTDKEDLNTNRKKDEL